MMQPDTRCRTQRREFLRESRFLGSGAVEEVHRASLIPVALREFIQTREERGDSYPAGNPDLTRGASLAVEREVAVRTFEGDNVPCLQGLRQFSGVVTKRLDGQGQRPIIRVPAGCDGEGMGPLGDIESPRVS